ncbi:MAG TPA: hypothetical protein VGL83_13690 [Stellaceae bacterium]|jgi:hypothetical protein
MVFGVAVLGAALFFFAAVVFFLVDFLAVLFFAGAFLAGAGVAIEVLGDVLWPCACAVTNGTVDVPTNASSAKAEINAFIWYSWCFLGCGQEGNAAPVLVEPSTD